jgi:hypothetical protein
MVSESQPRNVPDETSPGSELIKTMTTTDGRLAAQVGNMLLNGGGGRLLDDYKRFLVIEGCVKRRMLQPCGWRISSGK